MYKKYDIREALTDSDFQMINSFYNEQVEESQALDFNDTLDWILNGWEDGKYNLFSTLGNEAILERPISISCDSYTGYLMFFPLLAHDFVKEINSKTSNLFISDFHWSPIRLDTLATGVFREYVDVAIASLVKDTCFEGAVGEKVEDMFLLLSNMKDCIENGEELYADFVKEYQKIKDALNEMTLCLSIHPMDFLTMSVNSNGWTTSNNFINGTSRADAMSAMESETAVVAYVKSPLSTVSFDGKEWNSKLWRQLFYVDKEYLAGAGQFPTACDAISKIAMDWLTELAGEGLSETHSVHLLESPLKKNLRAEDSASYVDMVVIKCPPETSLDSVRIQKGPSPSCPCCGYPIMDVSKISCK